MSDPISRDDAKRIIDNIDTFCAGWRDYAKEQIDDLPTAEKVGKWINDKGLYRCTACNELWCDWWASCVSIERMNKNMPYCPKCGARMKGEEDESNGQS